mmetsp:Transcript_34637/g.52972  ORF Transcript_34637/g.52972 Transcript_34637/m.52972 type:complete len:284 (+) Transcript_34637:586-1437(+)
MIYDSKNNIHQATEFYEKSFNKIISIPAQAPPSQDPKQQRINDMHHPQNQVTFAKVCTNLAVCYEKLGNRAKALQLLQRISKNPAFKNEQNLANNLGVLHQRMGEYVKAQEHLGQALDIVQQPKQSEEVSPIYKFGLNFNMGITMMRSGRYDEALNYLNKARTILEVKISDMAPSNLDQYGYDPKTNRINLFVNLALVLQKKGDLRDALENSSEALKLAPTNDKIKILNEKIEMQLKEQENSPDFQNKRKKVLKNHPNAESLSSQHSRKSSLVTSAILAKSGK